MGEIIIEYINKDESWRIFDAAAQRHLGMTAEQFVALWDNGAYKGDEVALVMQVAMLRPSGR